MQVDIPTSAGFKVDGTDELLCYHCVKKITKDQFVKVVLLYDDCYDKCSDCGRYL